MGNSIISLPSVSSVSAGDSVALNSDGFGGDARATLATLLVWISENFDFLSNAGLVELLNAKQDLLVSGTNLKSINGSTLLGPGDLAISSTIPDGDKGDIVVSGAGTAWAFDPTVVTAAAKTVLDDATVAAMVNTLGGATSTGTGGLVRTDSAALTGTPTAPTAAPGANTTQLSTTAFVTAAIALAVTGLLDFKGATNCSANPNYPAASTGDAYVVSAAGRIGGGAGKVVDIGDVYVAIADNAGGNEAAVGTSWIVLEHNLAGALLAANNLSDVANVATARSNLGAAALAVSQSFTAGQAVTDVALTDAATVAIDAALSNSFYLLTTSGVGATRALGAPTNPKSGQKITFVVKQDGAGSRALTYNAVFKHEGGVAPVLSTGANAIDMLAYTYNGANSVWIGGLAVKGAA